MPTNHLMTSRLRDDLAARPLESVWSAYVGQVGALQPFWARVTEVWAERVALPDEKRLQCLATINSAFSVMDDWRFGRVKLLKKHRDAIDSAISFVRNQALNRSIAPLRMAPVARNTAGSLRMCLHIATFGYRDEQIPMIVAQEVFELAAIRSLYPVDLSNLTAFLPPDVSIHAQGGDIDNFHLMLKLGSEALGLGHELKALYAEADDIWREFDRSRPFLLPETLWSETGGELSARLYYEGMNAFHGR